MKIEWDAKKAKLNLKKHGVAFEEAATALSDPMAVTGADPDHSDFEERYITFGVSAINRLLVVSHTEEEETIRIISLAKRTKENENSMKKAKKTDKDELRPEYKRSDFRGGLVRGKYAKRLKESSNIVVLRPEVAQAFPNEEAVNDALLSLIDIAQKTIRPTRRSTGSAKKRASR